MFAELDEDHCPQPLLGQFRCEEGDGAGDPSLAAKPPEPPCDRGRRERDGLGELLRRARIVQLDGVQKRAVEIVEHDGVRAKIWHGAHPENAQLAMDRA